MITGEEAGRTLVGPLPRGCVKPTTFSPHKLQGTGCRLMLSVPRAPWRSARLIDGSWAAEGHHATRREGAAASSPPSSWAWLSFPGAPGFAPLKKGGVCGMVWETQWLCTAPQARGAHPQP